VRCQHMLNDTRIKQAKPKERDYKLADFDGLHLLVRPTGSKFWRFAYRFAGKQKRHALSLAADVGMPLVLGAVTRELLNLAKTWNRENQDWTAMLLLLEDMTRTEHLAPIYPHSL
jgi:hypothetical protein